MTQTRRVIMGALLVALAAGPATALLNFNPLIPSLSHASNLVTNGSFENGAPSLGSQAQWCVGPTGGPTFIPGWSASGTASTYAMWGSSGVPGQGIKGSASFPNGNSGLYFGNLFTDVSVAPVHQPSGRVNFSSPPTFTPQYGGPATLSQTINTPANPAPAYQISFWVSGEDAASAGTMQRGVFGFRMTNVLPGDPIQYLTVPSGVLGITSRVISYDFTPINPTLPVTIDFINWGHITSVGGVSSGIASELVLDDVIINTVVPEPGSAAVMVAGAAMCGLRRRK